MKPSIYTLPEETEALIGRIVFWRTMTLGLLIIVGILTFMR